MRIASLSFCFFASLFASGCNQGSEKVFDVPYYKEHAEERAKKLDACKKDPGGLGNTPNCINAEQAQLEIEASRSGSAQFKSVEF